MASTCISIFRNLVLFFRVLKLNFNFTVYLWPPGGYWEGMVQGAFGAFLGVLRKYCHKATLWIFKISV